jgi:hypothetical protein
MSTDRKYRDVLNEWALPITPGAVRVFRVALVCLTLLSLSLPLTVRSLGTWWYGLVYEAIVLLFVSAMAAEVWQLWKLWRSLHNLLVFLDRLPLRRTLRAMRDLSWDSIWGMGAAVLTARYQMIARQMEVLRHLAVNCNPDSFRKADIPEGLEVRPGIDALSLEGSCSFAPWFAACYASKPITLEPVLHMQERIADLSGILFRQILRPAWDRESRSLTVIAAESSDSDRKAIPVPDLSGALPTSPLIQSAEEFVCLNYLAFIQNCMGRLRTLITGMALLFLVTALSSASYPFDPQPMFGIVFFLLFVALAGSVVVVYAQAHRDATLSNITNTDPGKLGSEFYLKILQFVLGPALALLSVLVPSITDFLFTWIQPGQMK